MLESDGTLLNDVMEKCVSGKAGVMNVVMEAHVSVAKLVLFTLVAPWLSFSKSRICIVQVDVLQVVLLASVVCCVVVAFKFVLYRRFTSRIVSLVWSFQREPSSSLGSTCSCSRSDVSHSFFGRFLTCSTLLNPPVMSVCVRWARRRKSRLPKTPPQAQRSGTRLL